MTNATSPSVHGAPWLRCRDCSHERCICGPDTDRTLTDALERLGNRIVVGRSGAEIKRIARTGAWLGAIVRDAAGRDVARRAVA